MAVFCIGITGARVLNTDAIPVLRENLRAVLDEVKASLAAPAQLRLLSPLAEGADRLAAQAGLALGYALDVALPFACDEYEKDFPATIDEFRALLSKAQPPVVELSGARGADEGRSYEAVGRMVVDQCDLLIAIWNGGCGNGRGGTAEIVEYAASRNRPIWWLRADGGGEPCWLAGTWDFEHLASCSSGLDAWARLRDFLGRMP